MHLMGVAQIVLHLLGSLGALDGIPLLGTGQERHE